MKQHLEILFSLKEMEIKPEQILRGVTPPLLQRFLQTEQLLSIQFYIIIKILQNTLISLGCIPNPPGTITDNKLEFTPTEVEKGQTDIMYAQKISGNKNTTTNLKIQFTHALSQLKFKLHKRKLF